MMHSLLESAQAMRDVLVNDRRTLHKHPELALDLPVTTTYVMKRLREIGYDPVEICPSAVVATIGKPGKTILLRGDMDALPMQEHADLPFHTETAYAHLCGHDMHTAMLLGAAKLLKDRESELAGTVKFMFQPGEEVGAGAKAMVAAGLLENPHVDAAFAIHVDVGFAPGKFTFKKGVASSSMDTFYIDIQGKGGHSSTPQLAIDPLMIANTIYTLLSSLVGKEADPFETAVLAVGRMTGGTAPNIIPDSATMEGTLRCYNNTVRERLVKRVGEIAADIVKTLRGAHTINWVSTASVTNDPALCDILCPCIEEIVGKGNLIELQHPISATEDFSYVSELVPSMYIMAGAGPCPYPVHNPNVTFDENVLPYGAAVHASCAMGWLRRCM